MYGRVGSDAGRLVELGWVGPGSSLQQPSTLWGVFVFVYLSLYFVFVNHSPLESLREAFIYVLAEFIR